MLHASVKKQSPADVHLKSSNPPAPSHPSRLQDAQSNYLGLNDSAISDELLQVNATFSFLAENVHLVASFGEREKMNN